MGHAHVNDAMIIGSIIGNSVFLKDVTDIVISVLIMSFLVIIASLIAFINIFIERIRNQKVDIILDWLSVHI